MLEQITSTQNSKIKFLSQLIEKSRVRKRENCFVIEGKREITLAIEGGYTLIQVFYCPDILPREEALAFVKKENASLPLFEITSTVYKKVAYRDSTEGIIAIAQSKDNAINTLSFKNKTPLILIAESPEKPGNIGAILRTADAANIDAVIIANPKTDIYNPNIIRSSVGCIFTNHIATGSSEEIIHFLKQQNINIYGAALENAVNCYSIDYTKPSAIIVGTEATGLSDMWLQNTNKNVKIPMSGVIDSMNVSVAAGILIYEAKRQRNFEF